MYYYYYEGALVMWFIVGFAVAAGLGLIPAKIASGKGKNFGLWWLYGFLIFIVALIHSILLADERETKNGKVLTKSVSMIVGLDHIPDKVNISALVVIDGYSVVNTNNATVLKIKLTNFTDRIIRSVKVFAKGYNDFGDIVRMGENDSFEMLLQDMSLKDSLIYNFELPKEVSAARKFDFIVDQVCYENGEIQSSGQPEYVKTGMADKIQDEYYLRFAKTKTADAKYYAEDHGKYWNCICGYVNTGDKCRYCIVSKQTALGFTKENIVDTCRGFKDIIQEEERKKTERRKRIDTQKTKIKSVENNMTTTVYEKDAMETSNQDANKNIDKNYINYACIGLGIFFVFQVIDFVGNMLDASTLILNIVGLIISAVSVCIMIFFLRANKNILLPIIGLTISSIFIFAASDAFHVYYRYPGQNMRPVGNMLLLFGNVLLLLLALVSKNIIKIKNKKKLHSIPLASGVLIILYRIVYSIPEFKGYTIAIGVSILWLILYIVYGIAIFIVATKIYKELPDRNI